MTPNEIRALADRAEQRPPFFSSCRWGFHRTVKVQRLLTTGRDLCIDCGAVFLTSLFGDFAESRHDGAEWLRAQANALDEKEAA